MDVTDSKSVASHTVRTGPGSIQVDLTGQADKNQSIIVGPDGKILVSGFTEYLAWGYPGAPGEESYGYEQDHSIVRLNADGSLDTTFGGDGIDIVPAARAPEARGEKTVVQADGKILIAVGLADSVQLERYNSDGTPDTTFGTNGVTSIDIAYDFRDADLKALPDGTFYFSVRGPETTSVFKLNNDGSPMGSFGDNGVLVVDGENDPSYHSGIAAVQADGSVVTGYWNGFGFQLQRFTPDGELDTTFGTNGRVSFNPALGLEGVAHIVVQDDGKIIVMDQTGGYTLASVFRLNADGSFDTSFGGDGRVVLEFEDATSLAVQKDGKVLVAGSGDRDFNVLRLNADGSVDTSFGSQDGKLHVDGYTGGDDLRGADAAEVINGLAGDDVLQGNGGRDLLQGGAGADIFRFTETSDSYRSAAQLGSDRILDFDASQDRIDLTALGFTGIGNGHNGTLAVQTNADGTRTYLKSYDADASGQRFELALDGNLVGQLNETNLVFTAPTLEGTSGKDTITGSALSEIIYGLAGNDNINGGAGADVIIGGAGADRLDGGDRADIWLLFDGDANDDVFRYTSTEDSYRAGSQSFVDLIVNMTAGGDKIDVSALGYTGFGDGTGTTLKVVYNEKLERTYLQDVEVDAKGHSFQIALQGDWRESLYESDMIFAPDAEVGLVGVPADVDQQHLCA